MHCSSQFTVSVRACSAGVTAPPAQSLSLPAAPADGSEVELEMLLAAAPADEDRVHTCTVAVQDATFRETDAAEVSFTVLAVADDRGQQEGSLESGSSAGAMAAPDATDGVRLPQLSCDSSCPALLDVWCLLFVDGCMERLAVAVAALVAGCCCLAALARHPSLLCRLCTRCCGSAHRPHRHSTSMGRGRRGTAGTTEMLRLLRAAVEGGQSAGSGQHQGACAPAPPVVPAHSPLGTATAHDDTSRRRSRV